MRRAIEKRFSLRFVDSCFEELEELSKQCRPEPEKETIRDLLLRNPYLANLVATSVVAQFLDPRYRETPDPRYRETLNIISKEYGSINFLFTTPFMSRLDDSLRNISNGQIETKAQIKLWAFYHLVVNILNIEDSIFNFYDRKALMKTLVEIEKFVSDIERYVISDDTPEEDVEGYEFQMKTEVNCFMEILQDNVKEEKYSEILKFSSYFEAE